MASSALICLTSKNRMRSVCRGVPALANGGCLEPVPVAEFWPWTSGHETQAAEINKTPMRRIGLDMMIPDQISKKRGRAAGLDPRIAFANPLMRIAPCSTLECDARSMRPRDNRPMAPDFGRARSEPGCDEHDRGRWKTGRADPR